jgi:intracellular sulfur oxidation DsrE/DsrF family protein
MSPMCAWQERTAVPSIWTVQAPHCTIPQPYLGLVTIWRATSEIVAVFHTNAGHVTLHDTAYNAGCNIATGNPYKNLISDLQKRGVMVELCGATAKAHGWGNEDLLPDIKVNTDAMARTTQLVQQGFVKITE